MSRLQIHGKGFTLGEDVPPALPEERGTRLTHKTQHGWELRMFDKLGLVVVEEGFALVGEYGDARAFAGHYENLLVFQNSPAFEVGSNQVYAFFGCNPDVVLAIFLDVQLMSIQQFSVLRGKVDTLHLSFFYVNESYTEVGR